MERLHTFTDYQAALYLWGRDVLEGQTVQAQIIRAMQEWHETLEEVVEYDGSKEAHDRLAKEIIDVIISLSNTLVLMGVDLAGELTTKLLLMFQKYNPVRHQELRGQGMTHDEAMAVQKAAWKGNNGKREISTQTA